MTTRATDLPADAEARQLIQDALDETLVVEAAAGTGKTTELVTRILSVLLRGRATMDEIVAVTFTEKAAGELKLRLRQALEQAREPRTDAPTEARIEQALKTLEEAHVNTIHGFCAELLRERPVEARVDPLFSVLTEAQAGRVYARAFGAWLQETLADPPDGVRRALRRGGGGIGANDGPTDRLRDAGWTLAGLREYAAPWARRPFDRGAAIDRLVAALHRLTDLSRRGSERDPLRASLDGVRRLSGQIALEQSLGQRDLDAWEARLVDLTRDRGLARTRKGSGARYGDVARAEVIAARDAFYADLLQFRTDADADLAARLHGELAGATARYQQIKERQGALDFVDLLGRTRDLLRDNRPVRRHLQRRFQRLFVDEFQDTDPVQAEILLLLCADDDRAERWEASRPEPGKLFLVGDPKQAIYRFRGADVGTYWRVRDHLAACGGRVLQLKTNFRSVPAIQRLVNYAFEAEMTADPVALQAGYVPLAERRRGDDSRPAVVVLPVPEPYSTARSWGRSPTAKAIDRSLPDAVGAFIAWLVEQSGWTVSERDSAGGEQRVPVEPRHVAVLFRRFTSYTEDVTRPYIDAIEARGIPHLLVGGKAFHNREEVETIRAALAAIEWPDDALSVFATLKGALFAIDDEALLAFRDRFGPAHPFRIPRELGGNSGSELALAGEPLTDLLPVAGALRLLQRLHTRRNDRPVADTLGDLLAATRAHVAFILRPAGEQALANVLHVAELARQYEAGGGISFRGFIGELRRAAESSEAAEAPIVEEGSDGVRLMTVHKAKGLEFPVVILADLTCRMSRGEASRYLDGSAGLCAVKIGGWAPRELFEHDAEEVARDRAEGVRLAYVAATRARDLLVVPAVGDDPYDEGWLAPLNRAVYPPPAGRRRSAPGPNCPTFTSRDTVLQRPDGEGASDRTVAPGAHAFDAPGYEVVWWDPRALSLGAQPPFGVRREELIARDVDARVVADGRRQHETWRAAREAARAVGRRPSLRVETVRERAAEAPVAGAADIAVVDLRRTDRGGAPADGAAFGALVHAILAQVPLDGGSAAVGPIAAAEARLLGAAPADVAGAQAIVAGLLDHDLLGRARAAAARQRCRRETPVTWIAPDGALVEGVVDLAFEEDGRWTVVDYKTDREIAASGLERYRRQVALYVEAVAAATGQPASGVLVRV